MTSPRKIKAAEPPPTGPKRLAAQRPKGKADQSPRAAGEQPKATPAVMIEAA